MKLIQDAFAGIALGSPQAYRNLTLFPLLEPGPGGTAVDYLLLDEALGKDLVRITEISEAGSVPELAFENSAAEAVLLVDGDELVGAKQNRVLNLSILVGGGQKVAIPVSCVEAGRWAWRSERFAAAKRMMFAKARARKMVRVSESLRATGSRQSDQGEVWDDIADKVAFCRAEAPTGAMGDAYAATGRILGDYADAFRAEPGQRGVIAAIDGKVVGLELFDAAATFARFLDKLVRSYALDAVETATKEGRRVKVNVPQSVAGAFLARLREAQAERFKAVGEGEDIRLTGEGIAGGALAARGRIVHLAGFAVAP